MGTRSRWVARCRGSTHTAIILARVIEADFYSACPSCALCFHERSRDEERLEGLRGESREARIYDGVLALLDLVRETNQAVGANDKFAPTFIAIQSHDPAEKETTRNCLGLSLQYDGTNVGGRNTKTGESE